MCVCDSDACERVPTCVDALYADELMSMFRVWRHENMQSSKTLTAASDLRPAAFLSSLDPAAQCVCWHVRIQGNVCVCVCLHGCLPLPWGDISELCGFSNLWTSFLVEWTVSTAAPLSPDPSLWTHTHTHTHIHGFLSVVGHLRMSFILHLDFSTLTLTKNRFSLRNQLKHISSGSSWNYND